MRLLFSIFMLIIAGCAAPQNTSDVKAAEPQPKTTIEEKTDLSAKNVAAEEKRAAGKPGEVDYSCKTASDCKIKDVGSCCGYRPACVNKDSETYPEQVKAECAKNGMAGICGFPSIASCTCTNSKCEGLAGPGEEALQ